MEQVLNYILKKAEEIRISETPLFIAIDDDAGSGKQRWRGSLQRDLMQA